MNITKYFSAAAIICIISLTIALVTTQNPLDKQYNKTVQSLLKSNDLSSESEIMTQFPELQDIKTQIKKLNNSHAEVQSKTQHPISSNREATNQMMERCKLIKQQQTMVLQKLKQLREIDSHLAQK